MIATARTVKPWHYTITYIPAWFGSLRQGEDMRGREREMGGREEEEVGVEVGGERCEQFIVLG